jgi:hypothetical protein
MIPVKLGSKIPLFVAVSTEVTDYIVMADLFMLDPYTVLFEDVPLPWIPGTPGHYLNETIDMIEEDRIYAVYSVYASDGVARLAKAEEVFGLARSCIDGEELIGIIEDDVMIGEIKTCE